MSNLLFVLVLLGIMLAGCGYGAWYLYRTGGNDRG